MGNILSEKAKNVIIEFLSKAYLFSKEDSEAIMEFLPDCETEKNNKVEINLRGVYMGDVDELIKILTNNEEDIFTVELNWDTCYAILDITYGELYEYAKTQVK